MNTTLKLLTLPGALVILSFVTAFTLTTPGSLSGAAPAPPVDLYGFEPVTTEAPSEYYAVYGVGWKQEDKLESEEID